MKMDSCKYACMQSMAEAHLASSKTHFQSPIDFDACVHPTIRLHSCNTWGAHLLPSETAALHSFAAPARRVLQCSDLSNAQYNVALGNQAWFNFNQGTATITDAGPDLARTNGIDRQSACLFTRCN